MTFAPAIIPVPSYLLSDEELKQMVESLREIDEECHDKPDDDRTAACIAAIRIELAKRGKPISLKDLGQ